jgi:enoyl-CoA hydratase/carnithine racemase
MSSVPRIIVSHGARATEERVLGHLRLAAATARVTFRQAAMGMITGWGGGPRLFRLVGRSTALRLLLTAETIDAAEALRVGLIDRVVEPERLREEAMALAAGIGAQPAAAISAFLELDRVIAASLTEAEAEEAETRLFARLWTEEDFRSRLADWQNRR